MSKIISIGTALPAYRHQQLDILQFMKLVYAMNEAENRKLKFLYQQSGIDYRYSVIPDYSRTVNEWKFYPQTENLEPFPSLEKRMRWFNKFAPSLSVDAVRNCLANLKNDTKITHLITVSCTGMSAPGLDLQIMEMLNLPKNIYRTSINFMGCYAAIHGLKIADVICKSDPSAKVMLICTELCTLHFQRYTTLDSITSALLFGDGAAAALICNDAQPGIGMHLNHFYSEVITKGKKAMAWEMSSSGFVMTLSGYVPELIEEDFGPLVQRALTDTNLTKENIKHWCMHPGGKRILDAIHRSLSFNNAQLKHCYDILREYGNMSSATILFVLEKIFNSILYREPACHLQDDIIFGAAFGPGLTMETFLATATF